MPTNTADQHDDTVASPRQGGTDPEDPADRVRCHLDTLLETADMTLTALADEVGVTVANLSILKNDRARAIRFSTMVAICDVLGCQPGDLLTITGASERR